MANGLDPGAALPQTPERTVGLWWPWLAGAAAFILYLRTLLPDFGGPEDSPKFQFLGYVLGTAHEPGYPLYVMLDWLFSLIPVGTVAFRANLMSAVWGASAVAFAALLSRELRVGRLGTAIGAAGLATGAWFWWYSVLAEVYTLAAFLVVLSTLCFVRWTKTAGDQWLYAAACSLGLATAHHPLAYGIVPAAAALVMACRRAHATNWRALAASVVLFALGYTPYVFLVARTHWPAPYMEATARNLTELLDVMRLQGWSEVTFAFDARNLLLLRTPLLGRVLVEELGSAGVVLVGVGVALALVRRRRDLAFVGGAVLGMLLLVLPTAGDVPALVGVTAPLLWTLAAFACDALVDAGGARRPLQTATALALVALVPAWALVRNFPTRDLSRDTGPARFFRSLYNQVPGPASFVLEDYWVEMMRLYPLLAEMPERRAQVDRISRDPARVRAVLASGRTVLAFERATQYLSSAGFLMREVAVRERDLATFLRELPRGAILVAVASGRTLPPDIELAARQDGRGSIRARPSRYTAVALRPSGGLVGREAGDQQVSLELRTPALREGPNHTRRIVVSADAQGVRIEADGFPIVGARTGLAMAVIDERGEVLMADTFDDDSTPVRPEILARVPRLARVERELGCVDMVPGAWTDLRPLDRPGAVGAFIAPGGGFRITLEVRGSQFLSPSVEVPFGEATAVLERTDSGSASSQETLLTRPLTFTTTVADVRRASTVRVRLGGVPVEARARLEPGGSTLHLRLCAVADVQPPASRSDERALPIDDAGDLAFAAGFRPAERAGVGRLRWTSGDVSSMVLPVRRVAAHQLVLEVRPGLAGARLALWVNGRHVNDRTLEHGWQRVVWTIPAEVLSQGPNEIGFAFERPQMVRDYGRDSPGTLGWAVRSVVLAPVSPGP